MPAGYSGTPLPKKLGLKPGMALHGFRPPPGFAATLGELPEGSRFVPRLGRGSDHVLVVAFAARRRDLDEALAKVPPRLAVDGAVWFCWPKKASGIVTDFAESEVRAGALAAGLVDVKICAVDETWSGLKCCFRRKDRESLRNARSPA